MYTQQILLLDMNRPEERKSTSMSDVLHSPLNPNGAAVPSGPSFFRPEIALQFRGATFTFYLRFLWIILKDELAHCLDNEAYHITNKAERKAKGGGSETSTVI